jgi:hypothetical protein
MAKTKLEVKTEHGTFTRTTARTYTHLVIAKGYRAEKIEASRLFEITEARKDATRYRKVIAQGHDPQFPNSAEWLAEGKYAQWAEEADQRAARLEAVGPITADLDNWGLHDANLASTPTWGVLGWCGRLDLARKLADTDGASRYRTVHIIDVATGQVVR